MSEMSDNTEFGGIVTVEVIRDGKNGPEVVQRSVSHNLVVNIGKKQIWRMVMGLNTHLFKYFRLGINSVAAASNQTNVVTPVAGSLTVADSMSVIAGQRSAQWVISYPSGAGGGVISTNGIKEVCLLDSPTSPGGSAMMRALISPVVNKTKADKLKVTYVCRIS